MTTESYTRHLDFLIMQHQLTTTEVDQHAVLEDMADVDWTILDHEQYEDIMSQTFDIFTDDNPDMVHAF